jgi:hypothetical protein
VPWSGRVFETNGEVRAPSLALAFWLAVACYRVPKSWPKASLIYRPRIPSPHNHCQDPFLSSALVGPQIQGIQSNNISACVKHWIFNNQECNRQSFSANVAERVGRELYTPGFFAAVDAGVGSVMCAL